MNTDAHTEAFLNAARLHQAGQLQRAEQGYRQILQANPQHPDALHGLGVLAVSLGHREAGLELLRDAVANAPGHAPFLISLGSALREDQKPAAAAEAFHQALQSRPNDPALLNLLGLALQESNRHAESIAWYRLALQQQPQFIEALNNLASAYKAIHQLDNAVQSYMSAIRIRPDIPEIHYNLGNALTALNRMEEAVRAYQQAIELKPDFVEAHNNLGDAQHEQGCYAAAVHSYQRTLELRPSFSTAYNNLGNALVKLGQLDAAVATYQRALTVLPDHPEIYNNLGNALRDQGKLTAAEEAYRRALSIRPAYAEALFNLGNLQSNQGQVEAAISAFEQALKLEPGFMAVASALIHQLQIACDWDSQRALTARLVASVDGDDIRDSSRLLSPLTFIGLSQVTTPEQQYRCARQWATSQFRAFEPIAGPRGSRSSLPRRPARHKLRVAYLSADFRPHPVALLTAELFEKHARDRCDVYGYSIGRDDDSPLHRRIVSAFDRFRDLSSMPFREAAMTIANDEIDILVDLQGYTHGCRTEILAQRPAPIQVNYLGFPGTMGADFIDYILVDDFVVPIDQQPFFSERLVHLPGCFMVNDSQREIAARTPTRAEAGLPEQGFVFCAFNSSFKITETMFELWLRLLHSIPRSLLWLKDWNPMAVNHLRRRAILRGIEVERLIFAADVAMPDHLARHRLADLFLDTFPYNQHSTASDALRVGLPLVTLAGNTFASRVAGSLLRELGLDDLIAHSVDEYEALAQRLATQPEYHNQIRKRLADNLQQTLLYDGARFAKTLERAFHAMWERHRSGLPPSSLRIDAGR